MSCLARYLLYALLLFAYVLKNISTNSNITIAPNVTEISNSTMVPNVLEDSNITMTDNETVNNTTESYTNTTLKMIQSLTDVKIYNKNLRPYLGEKAVEVDISIWVNDIISVSDYTNEFTVNMYVHQHWYDPRLQFTPTNNVSKLLLVRDFAKLIWLSDTHILNSKSLSMELSDSTLTSAKIRLHENGKVYYKNTFTTTVNCPMDLEYFPVDQQICKLIFRSYSYFNSDLDLYWKRFLPPVLIKPNISLSTFTLTSYNISKKTGSYDALVCAFRFKRILGYYINQIYLPSFMIVLISWIPFWLNRADHYARVGLGVTTVLTITTMVISTNESLPKTSYIKAIDVYLFVCFLMVFLAMVEFAMIGFFESEEQSYTLMETKEMEEPVTDKLDDKVDKSKAPKTKKRNTARIDKVARVFFPTVFITFNLVYVSVLFYISNYFYSHLDKDFKNFEYINI